MVPSTFDECPLVIVITTVVIENPEEDRIHGFTVYEFIYYRDKKKI